jgi:hypothetical protein
VLGDEVGMLAQAIARAFYLDDDGVVQQAIEQRGGDDGLAEDSPHSEKPRFESWRKRLPPPATTGR